MSSAEAELIALVKSSAELLGIRSILKDWGLITSGIIYADSSAALAIANRKGAGKLRHIHVSALWVQEKQDHEIEYRKVLGAESTIDVMTKYLVRDNINSCMARLQQELSRELSRLGFGLPGGSKWHLGLR